MNLRKRSRLTLNNKNIYKTLNSNTQNVKYCYLKNDLCMQKFNVI